MCDCFQRHFQLPNFRGVSKFKNDCNKDPVFRVHLAADHNALFCDLANKGLQFSVCPKFVSFHLNPYPQHFIAVRLAFSRSERSLARIFRINHVVPFDIRMKPRAFSSTCCKRYSAEWHIHEITRITRCGTENNAKLYSGINYEIQDKILAHYRYFRIGLIDDTHDKIFRITVYFL